jgi:integrase
MHRSRSTMSDIKTLSGILSKYAKDQDIVMKTYYDNVRIPKIEKKKIDTFSDTEIKTLFKSDSKALVDTILILIYTGMRISELLKLTKFDVDIKNMLITGGVKTDAGKDRVIPVHPKIKQYVTARYESCSNFLIEYEKEVGSVKNNDKRMVKRPYNTAQYRDEYYAVLDSLGIRRLTPHKARHTFFTLLSAKCKDRKAMAMIGGHSDPSFSEKAYVQPDIERLRNAIEKL